VRRTLLTAATVVAAVVATVLSLTWSAGATSYATDDGKPSHYTTTPLWTRPIAANAPVSPDNAYFVSWEKANEPANYWKIRGAGTNPYGEPFAVSHCTDPVYKFTSTASLPAGQTWLATVGFHAPDAVFKNMLANNDQPFVVMDTCGNSSRPAGFSVWGANVHYDGTRVLKSATTTGGNITGGSFGYNTNGLDSRNPASDAPADYNSVSRGRPPDTMFVRDYLLQHPVADGTIGYSPEAFFIETNSAAGDQSPLIGHENGQAGCGGTAHPGICAEGQFVRINPAKVLPSTCTGPARVLAKTLQVHGAYLGDNSGSGSGFKGESGTTVLTANSLANCMTLSDLQIMAKGYTP
jgi:hypothetical protein